MPEPKRTNWERFMAMISQLGTESGQGPLILGGRISSEKIGQMASPVSKKSAKLKLLTQVHAGKR